MNILCTKVVEDEPYSEMIRDWRARGHIIEEMPSDRLARYMRLDSASSLAAIDVIVCYADERHRTHRYSFLLTAALEIARDVRSLPESCAMRDGRKWRSLPFIVINERPNYIHYEAFDERCTTHAAIISPSPYPSVILMTVRDLVDEYIDRVLDDYESLGMIVRFHKGHAQIGPALKKKQPDMESSYYYSPADRRRHRRWLTVMRDSQGLQVDVEIFRQMLDRSATETEIQHFFEEHPMFLMQARNGIPIPHPRYSQPAGWSPDFALSPVLGPKESDEIELLEMKGPGAQLLNRVKRHAGFSSKVHSAIDQVRDYGRYLSHEDNRQTLLKVLGYSPSRPKLAVLIGRAPKEVAGREITELRQSEIDVQVITYDEILQTQVNHLRSYFVG